MSRNQSLTRAAFTLLELVVVLSILAIVTALAVRALDGVEDQRRYEAAQRGLEELEFAILGSPDDRAADGSRTVSGFVADMGRLPHTVAETLPYNGGSLNALTLGELWQPPPAAQRFDVRRSDATNTTPPTAADADVRVPAGWRGPYLRLPLGADTLLDGWGNPYISPHFGTTPAARLLADAITPITDAGHPIRAVRHLGGDGMEGGTGYDRDVLQPISAIEATIVGNVEVLPADGPTGGSVIVRLFSPDPSDVTKIRVLASTAVTFTSSPVPYEIVAPNPGDITIGPRILRAYREAVAPGTLARSRVATVTLRPGVNHVDLTIDRP